MRTRTGVMCTILALSAHLAGRGRDQPWPGVPKTRDGSQSVKARTPRTADGTPNLSGLWRTRTVEIAGVEPLT
jgi:hypothetical protein